MVQSILVGLDVSEVVDQVAAVATQLAVFTGASVQAVYVEDTSFLEGADSIAENLPPGGHIPFRTEDLNELADRFESEESILGKRFLELISDQRIRGTFMVEQGDVSRVLLRESRFHDLVVLGKFGESQSAAYRDIPPLGAHIEEVVRRSYAPVVLVPPGAAIGPRYLVAYDGSPGAHRALSLAVRLRKHAGAELSVLSVSTPDHTEALLSQVGRYLEAHDSTAELVARTGEAAEEILQFANEWKADLLAMGAFGRGTLQQRRNSATPTVLHGLDRVALVCGPMEA